MGDSHHHRRARSQELNLTGGEMNGMTRGFVVACLIATSVSAWARGERVFLRNDARLVQTTEGGITTFRCEKMGSKDAYIRRWVRDCNALAREEMESLQREGKLAAGKIARAPLGDAIVNQELAVSMPFNAAGKATPGPVADR